MATKSMFRPGGMDPEEIKRTVEAAKRSGLISVGGDRVKIGKAGDAATGLGKMESKWVDITPEMASHWLKNNFRNRPLKDDVIEAYARDMRHGRWMATHQGVAFNDQDELIDGQHRLNAIRRSGRTIRMMVTFGLPAEIDGHEMKTMDCVDRGRARTVGDQLTIQHGMKRGPLVASITAAIVNLCCQQRTRRVGVGETLEVFRLFEEPVQWVIEHRSKVAGVRNAGVLAGFAFARAVDGAQIEEMFSRLGTGRGLEKLPVMGLLRAFLVSDEARLFNRSLDRGLSELTLQAIHLQRLGRTPDKLEMALDGANHYRAAQPERVKKVAGLFKA